jgi:hypothetical protein
MSNSGNYQIAIGYSAGESNTGNNLVAIGAFAGDSNALDNQFILKQNNASGTPLIQGNFQSGSIGIGLALPQANLHVVGNILATTNITASGNISASGNIITTKLRDSVGNNHIVFGNNNNTIAISSDDVEIMRLDGDSQRVGINKTTPGEALEVVGNISASGNLQGANFHAFNDITRVGVSAGSGNTGIYQTAVGNNAGYSNDGDNQIAVGNEAGDSNQGDSQIAIGYQAGLSNYGNNQIAIGIQAGSENLGDNQIVIGGGGGGNSGNNLIAIGNGAGNINTLDNQFIVLHSDANATPLIQGNFQSGSIGIGLALPQANLHVSGNIWASGSKGHITASANISASGLLFISASQNTGQTYGVLVRDPATGRVYHTGSYSTGGTGGGDDLGNHTATQALDMNSNSIKNVTHITASGNISASKNLIVSGAIITNTLKQGSTTNTTTGIGSHAEGTGTTASGSYSHAEGSSTTAIGLNSHAEGQSTTAYRPYSHAEGYGTQAQGYGSHAEGHSTIAQGNFSHAEGSITTAQGYASHAEGFTTIAQGQYSHAEGQNTTAQGYASHAEGFITTASGDYSHAEGIYAKAIGDYSHAEGQTTRATAVGSHAEGVATIAQGVYSHAEGGSTIASGYGSHAEGNGTQAQGYYSHAEGLLTTASGDYSHAEGLYTVTSGSYQHAQGQYNISSSAQSAFIIGNGTGIGVNRSNLVFASGSQFQITGSLTVLGNITASNNISASGTIFGTFQQITGITVTSQSWASGSIYSSSISNANITSNTVVDVIPDNADYTIVLAAQLLPQNVSSTNEVIIFAVNEPTDDINVTLNLFK